MLSEIDKSKWVIIDEYPDYLINPNGQIYSTITNKILRGQIVNGYLRVELQRDGEKSTRQYVHKLVAKTFIPNPNNNPKVYFINGDHLDCRVSNLKWGTQKDALNTEYALKRKSECQKGKSKSLHSTKKRIKTMQEKYGVKVEQYTMDGVLLSKFNAYGEAHRMTGVQAASIRRCCLGKVKTAGGFIWRHADSE
jgi:hypothetical protein